MNITIRQIEIFTAIAIHGNVTKAAEGLLLSQSAASMALAELENQVGQKLFHRSSKKLELNEVGRILLPKASELLSRISEIEGMFSDEAGNLSGSIKVGTSSTIGNYLITSYLGRFSEKNPKVEFSLEVGNTDQIINSLLNYNIDIGYIEGFCHHPKIKTTPWRTDKLVIFASPQHPLAKKKNLKLNDLEDANWILREKGSGTREIFEKAIHGKINNINIGFEFGHTEAIKHAVKSNLGISCLSILAVAELLKNGVAIELKVPQLDLSRYFYTLIHKEKYHSNVLMKFKDFINEHNKI